MSYAFLVFQCPSDVAAQSNYVNVFCLGLIWLTGIPQTLKQRESRRLLYRGRWAVRSNFTPRSRKAMQFTCPPTFLIAGSVAVGFSTSEIYCFSSFTVVHWHIWHLHGGGGGGVACVCMHMYAQNTRAHKAGCSVFVIGNFSVSFSPHQTVETPCSCSLTFPFQVPNVSPSFLPLVLGNSITEQCCWKPFLYVFMYQGSAIVAVIVCPWNDVDAISFSGGCECWAREWSGRKDGSVWL